jgi:hypothetical protein
MTSTPGSGKPPKAPYAKVSPEEWKRAVDQVDRQIEAGTLQVRPEPPSAQEPEPPSHPADVQHDLSESSRNEASQPPDSSRPSSQGSAERDATNATGKVSHPLRAPILYWHWLAIVAMAFLFGVFVWPTPFEYHALDDRSFFRISRFSGRVDAMTDRGWVQLGQKK